MPVREVEKLATGGIWVGQQAVAVGLADRLGTFEQTVAELNRQVQPQRSDADLRLERIKADRLRGAEVAADLALGEREKADDEAAALRSRRMESRKSAMFRGLF